MDDIVLARFKYGRLDRPDQRVRIRLNSTVINVRNTQGAVDIAYMRDGKVARVQTRHCVLACFNMAIPYLMPELPQEQARALQENVKAPLVYTKVLVRNWRALVKLGVHEISAPMSFHCRVKLDYPVSLGRYRHARDPSEPMCLHLVHVPNDSNPGLEARNQFRIGRMKLLEMTFADFETNIRGDLDRMLGPGGFSSGARHRGDHRQSLVARLFLRGQFPVRWSRARRPSSSGRASRRAASPSPIPTRPGTPMPIARSTRPTARCVNCCASAGAEWRYFAFLPATSAFTLASNSEM